MINLCIDVGLRNLSMCIMNSEYQILLWDVYNVLDSDDHHCQCNFKDGRLCNRKCIMKYVADGNTIFTCKSHFPKNIKATKDNDFKKKNIDEYLLQDIAKSFIKKIQEIYDANPVFKELNGIYIELQPKLNPKMVFISHILYGKLTELYMKYPVIIRFVKASQKLKAYTGQEIVCNLKGKYAQRKWLSVQYCRWFLENKFSVEQRERWLPFLMSKKVQFDMCDCMLMIINSISGIPKRQLKHKNGNELK